MFVQILLYPLAIFRKKCTMKWFRMHTDFYHNPKVQVLTEALQRRYVMLLCLQCEETYENSTSEELALSLRITVEDWEKTKEEFISRNLLDDKGNIYGWENRQYISDLKDPTAATRQKRYRDKKRNERNDTVTSRLPETDTETETYSEPKTKKKEKKGSSPSKAEKAAAFDSFYSQYPRKVGNKVALKAWLKLTPEEMQLAIDRVSDEDFQIHMRKQKRGKKDFRPHPSTWLNGGCWTDEIAKTFSTTNGDPF